MSSDSGAELHEAELFHSSGSEDDDASTGGAAEEDSSDEDAGSHAEVEAVEARPVPGGHIGHPHGKSLENIAEDEAQSSATAFDTPKGTIGGAIVGSMPVGRAVRMGSSVPISIPGMPLFKQPGAAKAGASKGDSRVPPAQQHPATFIPPHQLSQQEGFMFSLTGTTSPGTLLKRDRLKLRNAILQSTGFLEKEEERIEKVEVEGDLARKSVRKGDGGMSQAFLNHPPPGARPGV